MYHQDPTHRELPASHMYPEEQTRLQNYFLGKGKVTDSSS